MVIDICIAMFAQRREAYSVPRKQVSNLAFTLSAFANHVLKSRQCDKDECVTRR